MDSINVTLAYGDQLVRHLRETPSIDDESAARCARATRRMCRSLARRKKALAIEARVRREERRFGRDSKRLGTLGAVADVFAGRILPMLRDDGGALATLCLVSKACKRVVERAGVLPPLVATHA